MHDITAIGSLIKGSDYFSAFLSHPRLSDDQRANGLKALFEGKLEPTTYTFTRFLLERHRLNVLPEICTCFAKLYEEQHDIISVALVSADTMSDPQVQAIQTKLGERYKKTIRLTATVDPSLIGGFCLHVGDTVNDNSVSGKLGSIRRALSGTGA